MLLNFKTAHKDKKERTADAECMKAAYDMLCDFYHAPIYDYNGILTLSVEQMETGSILAINKIASSDINMLFQDKKFSEKLILWIKEHKRFLAQPKLIMRKEIAVTKKYLENVNDENVEEVLNKGGYTTISLRTGEVKQYLPYPKIIDNQYREFDRLLSIIFRDKTDLIKQWFAQVVFERRILRAKPTLILWGTRGAGKNFFLERIVMSVMNNMMQKLGTNWRDYNSFAQYRIAYIDETENSMDIDDLSSLSKSISGTVVSDINIKNVQNFQVLNECNFVVLSNRKPIQITEMPNNDKNNQWLVVEMMQDLTVNEDFTAFQEKHGADLSDFIERNIGAYIRKVLLPLYQNMMIDEDNRYGFRIPITDSVMKLVVVSSGSLSNEVDMALEMMQSSSEVELRRRFILTNPDIDNIVKHFSIFKMKNIISNELIIALSNLLKVRPAVMKKSLKQSIYFAREVRVIVGCDRIRGYEMNMQKYNEASSDVEQITIDEITDIINREIKYEDI